MQTNWRVRVLRARGRSFAAGQNASSSVIFLTFRDVNADSSFLGLVVLIFMRKLRLKIRAGVLVCKGDCLQKLTVETTNLPRSSKHVLLLALVLFGLQSL